MWSSRSHIRTIHARWTKSRLVQKKKKKQRDKTETNFFVGEVGIADGFFNENRGTEPKIKCFAVSRVLPGPENLYSTFAARGCEARPDPTAHCSREII